MISSGIQDKIDAAFPELRHKTIAQINAETARVWAGLRIRAGVNSIGLFVPFCSFQTPDGTQIGRVEQNAASVLYTTTSDRRLKENVVALESGIETVNRIKPRRFNYKESLEPQVGFIAQELNDVWPHVVSKGDNETEIEKTWGVDYGKLTPLLVKAIQDLSAMVETLKSEVAALKAKRA